MCVCVSRLARICPSWMARTRCNTNALQYTCVPTSVWRARDLKIEAKGNKAKGDKLEAEGHKMESRGQKLEEFINGAKLGWRHYRATNEPDKDTAWGVLLPAESSAGM